MERVVNLISKLIRRLSSQILIPSERPKLAHSARGRIGAAIAIAFGLGFKDYIAKNA